ncbi:hypothetical protein DY000_02030967 [Brassica cretica]|uniref:BZIP domain-containing protein n=1 Tax=Brassica cretica TaxID=69181 RepID=A0ABQ7DXQ0_BRACR|nr:hypothetical protein DY000_02030967 [Brassica cretica]
MDLLTKYIPSSTRSNKETQLLFSLDPASLERLIRKEARSSSTDNTTCVSLDSAQPPSTQTLVPSIDTRSPLSTDNTHLPSTNILHPTSIDSPSQTSIDTEPPDMVAPLILVRDNNGDLHDQEGHLRNAAGREAARRRFRGRKFDEFRRIAIVSIDARPRTSIDIHQSISIDRTSRASIDDTYGVNHVLQCPDNSIDRHGESSIDRHSEAAIDRQTPAPIDRRAPITYRVQMPKIDVALLNALRPKPKPSEYPPEPVSTPSDDGEDPMEDDRVPTGRTLRRRKGKVAKHLKRETREKEEDIKRMFCEVREQMRMRITLKKKSDPEQFAILCTVKGLSSHMPCATQEHQSASYLGLWQTIWNSGGIVRDLEVQIGNALVTVDLHVLDIKLNWNSSLLLGKAFLSTVGAVCNLQTNQLCLTLIDPNAHYDPIPVKTPQTISRRINDPGIIATCHCGNEYETDEWENDYYNPIMVVNDALAENPDDLYDEERLNMQICHETRQGDTTWGITRTCHPIDRAIHPSIDTHHQQSIDNNNATSIDNRPIPNTTVIR